MTICYQAYGIQDIVSQTLFSVVSYLHKTPHPAQIVIYTDRAEQLERFFQNHPAVALVPITIQDLRRWRGSIDFVHRVKLEVLKDCGHRWKGPLFYCDGDTYFLGNPHDLFTTVSDEMSLLHVAENQMDKGRDPLSKKIAKFLRKNEFEIANERIAISPATTMWNAGVIGVSEKNKELLPKMIELTDALYTKYQKHVMEQLAVSYWLQKVTTVHPANSLVYHYWNQKPEYQTRIDAFLASYPTIFSAVENFERFQFPEPREKQEKVSIWQRMLGA